jgi:hypothetical protein
MGEKLKKWADEGGVDDAIGGIANGVGAVAKISSNLKGAKALDERGSRMGRVDTLGNTMSGMSAGAELGSAAGPLGTLIGAGVGLTAGLGASLLSGGVDPQDQIDKEKQFQLNLGTGMIQNEDTFAQSTYTAENGMDVKGKPKQIEVERGELVLRKKGKAFHIDSSFEAMYRKSHKEGGEKYNARPGDIIVPKNKVASTKRNLKNRNWSAVESMRLALPKDEGQFKFADGVSGVRNMTREDPDKGSPVTYYKTKEKFSKRKKTEEIIYHRTANDSTKYGVVGTLGPTMDKEKKHANVYIDKKGNITWVNDPDSVAYHDKGNNERSFGIEIGGNMIDGKYEEITSEQTAALEKVTNFAFKKYSLNETNIKSHSESDGGKGARFNEGNDAVTAMQSLYKERPFTDDSEVAQFDGASVKYASQKGLTGQVGTGKSITVKASELNMGSTPKEKAVIANNDEFKVDSYKSYSEKEVSNGEEPESEEWYEQNVVAKADEERKGYTTLASYSGRQKYKDLGIKRTGYDFVPDVDPMNPKNKLSGFNDVRDTIVENWKKENPGKDLPSSWDDFANKDYDKAKANGQFSGNWSDDLSTGVVNAIIKPFYQNTKEARNDDFHNITDEKLRNDIIKAYDYVSTTEDNGTSVGRAFDRGFQRFDNAVSDGLDGSPYQGIKRLASMFPGAGMLTEKKIGKSYYNDPGNNVGTSIYNLIASGTLEEQENIIKGAIKKHNLDSKAQDYLYEVWSNPEVFKNQAMEATEDLNVVLAVAELPRLLYSAGTWAAKGGVPKAITKSKIYIDALKAGKISKNGKVTASGLKYLKSSKAYKRQARAAALSSEGSAPVKSFRKNLSNLFKNADGTTGNAALNDELAGLTDGITADSNLFQDASVGFKDSFNFFKNSWKVLKKMPENVVKKMSGTDYAEANKVVKRLEDITGLSAKELKNAPAVKVQKMFKDNVDKATKALDSNLKAKKVAWSNYEGLLAKSEEAREGLAKLGRLPKKANSGEIIRAQAKLDEAEAAMKEGEKAIKGLEEIVGDNWEDLRAFDGMDAISGDEIDDFVEIERLITEATEGIPDAGDKLKELKATQKSWTDSIDEIRKKSADAVSSGKKSEEVIATSKSYLGSILDKKREARKALKESLNKKTTDGLKKDVDLAKEAPELFKAMNKHEDVLKLFNSAGRFTPEVYNALRKKGALGPKVKEEADMFLPDDREKAKEAGIPGEINAYKEAGSDPDKVVIEGNEKEEEEDEGEGKSKPILDAVNNGLSTLSSYSGAAYNIARGLEEPDKVNRNYVNPALEKYEDNSGVQRNVIDEAFNVSMDNARNLSGGLASNFRSNIEKSWADKVGRNSQVNAQESQKATGVAGRNIQRVNQSKQYNASVDNKADQTDMQSKAATKGFLGQGLSDIATIGAVKTRDKNQMLQDEKIKEEYNIFGNRKTK